MAEPLLAAFGVTKSFGPVEVLHGVDFTVQRGEVHALVGENGAGKSTLMKILSGFHQPTSGAVRVDGRPMSFSGIGAEIGRAHV